MKEIFKNTFAYKIALIAMCYHHRAGQWASTRISPLKKGAQEPPTSCSNMVSHSAPQAEFSRSNAEKQSGVKAIY